MRANAFLACVAAAAAGFHAPGALAVEARYLCDDGSKIAASFVGGIEAPGAVTLRFADGRTVTLAQAASADGGRYADAAMEFWSKGRGATLTREGHATSCRPAP
ncbi:MliC family protein [Methylocella sp.]|uniref:MliC family protein n=1 Tax=Methylocella sp. TaxID=1978226 RepID=UPI003783B8DA